MVCGYMFQDLFVNFPEPPGWAGSRSNLGGLHFGKAGGGAEVEVQNGSQKGRLPGARPILWAKDFFMKGSACGCIFVASQKGWVPGARPFRTST